MTLHLLGFAFSLGGVHRGGSDGPLFLQKTLGAAYPWNGMVQLMHSKSPLRIDEEVRNVCLDLANKVSALVHEQKYFSVIGGDHTSAIGTWSGVFNAIQKQGDLGLIWIDAHMDSHTPETTESGRLHGMPLACLLGYGYPTLTSILSYLPKLKPENVCLIGVRSYEQGEAALLRRLNIRTYFIEEVKQRGFSTVLREAVTSVSKNTAAYGISLDLDALDPECAPGVDVSEPNGIQANDLYDGLASIATDPKLIGTEIVEFNPHRDIENKTEEVIKDVLKILGRRHDGHARG